MFQFLRNPIPARKIFYKKFLKAKNKQPPTLKTNLPNRKGGAIKKIQNQVLKHNLHIERVLNYRTLESPHHPRHLKRVASNGVLKIATCPASK